MRALWKAPFAGTLVYGYAMEKQAFGVVDHFLNLNVDVVSATIIHSAGCSGELHLKLIKYGVRFDGESIYPAAEAGAINGAIARVRSEQIVEPKGIAQIAASAPERAEKHDEEAVTVETGKFGSYLTAGQYRERSRALRDFAGRLRSGG